MKKTVKKIYSKFRYFPLAIMFLMLAIFMICTLKSANFITSYLRLQNANNRIVRVEKKAQKGKVIDIKNDYYVFWTEDLVAQRDVAVDHKKELLVNNDTVQWIFKNSQSEFGDLLVIFLFFGSFAIVFYGAIVSYGVFLAIITWIIDWNTYRHTPKYYRKRGFERLTYFEKNRKRNDERRRKVKAGKEWIRRLN